MKQYLVILILSLCSLSMLAESLLNFTGEYKGENIGIAERWFHMMAVFV